MFWSLSSRVQFRRSVFRVAHPYPLRRIRKTVLALALTLFGCSNQLVPVSTPIIPTVTLRLYATTSTLPLAADLSAAYNVVEPNVRFEVASGSFETILGQLIAGETPYFLSNHLPNEAEALSLWAAPIGQDGIAVIVHQDNPVESLTSEQVRQIFQGRITNWREVGGENLPITVFSREDGSGTRVELESLLLGARGTTPSAEIAPSSAAMRLSVSRTPGGIGYVSMGYFDSTVRALAVDGSLPVSEQVASYSYPLRSTLFVIGLSEPQTDYRALIAWMQSPVGQTVIGRRYAPLG
jgi:phosphate transport system substrate-binding protein